MLPGEGAQFPLVLTGHVGMPSMARISGRRHGAVQCVYLTDRTRHPLRMALRPFAATVGPVVLEPDACVAAL